MDGSPGRDEESPFPSFDCVPLCFRPGIIDIGEGGAFVEGAFPDVCHAGWDGDRGQGGTVREGVILDVCHAGWDGDRGQGGAALEGGIPDTPHAAVGRDHGGVAANDKLFEGGLDEAVPGGMVGRVRGVDANRLEGGAATEGVFPDRGHA